MGRLARAMADHPDARRVMFLGHEPDLLERRDAAHRCGIGAHAEGQLRLPRVLWRAGAGNRRIAWLLDPDLYAG